jgi:hypothetical protein
MAETNANKTGAMFNWKEGVEFSRGIVTCITFLAQKWQRCHYSDRRFLGDLRSRNTAIC